MLWKFYDGISKRTQTFFWIQKEKLFNQNFIIKSNSFQKIIQKFWKTELNSVHLCRKANEIFIINGLKVKKKKKYLQLQSHWRRNKKLPPESCKQAIPQKCFVILNILFLISYQSQQVLLKIFHDIFWNNFKTSDYILPLLSTGLSPEIVLVSPIKCFAISSEV